MVSALRYLPVGPVLLVCGVGTVASIMVFAWVARSRGLRRAVVVASRVALAGNVVMFVPIGALAALAFRSGWWRATVSGVALSLLVELLQLVLGRSADVDDVLLNSCGAALGAAVAVLASYLCGRGVVEDRGVRDA